MKQKLFAMMAAAMLLLGLTACSNDDNPSTSVKEQSLIGLWWDEFEYADVTETGVPFSRVLLAVQVDVIRQMTIHTLDEESLATRKRHRGISRCSNAGAARVLIDDPNSIPRLDAGSLFQAPAVVVGTVVVQDCRSLSQRIGLHELCDGDVAAADLKPRNRHDRRLGGTGNLQPTDRRGFMDIFSGCHRRCGSQHPDTEKRTEFHL